MTEYKKLYDQLLKSEDLWDVFPEATGVWAVDMKGFIQAQDELDYILNTEEINDYDYDEEEDFD